LKVGERYHQTQHSSRQKTILPVLAGAALIGVLGGTGSVVLEQKSASSIIETAKPLAVSAGLIRARAPQEGDYWAGCDAARAAGTAPIYLGEPGYHARMDGDSDGIACEPHRGR